jgi:TIR domain
MPPQDLLEPAAKVFCSYSHKDEPFRQEFEAHVALMRRRGWISMWHDRKILAGDDWAGEIDDNLNAADIVTLLVSADFLNSDYCFDKETARAMERRAKEGTLVVPIIVRPCDWHDAPFGTLQAIPQDGKAVSSWPNRDEAWTDVAQRFKLAVRLVIECLRKAAQADMDKAENAFLAATRTSPLAKLFQQQQMENWKMIQQAQERIFAIQQDVMANRAAAQSEAYEKWDEYIRKA